MNVPSFTDCKLLGGPIDGKCKAVRDEVHTLVIPMREADPGIDVWHTSDVYYERSGPAAFTYSKTTNRQGWCHTTADEDEEV